MRSALPLTADAEQASAPAPQDPPRRRGRRLLLGGAAAAAVVLGTGGAAAAVAAGEALPGTTLAGVDVGGLGRADLRAAVDGPARQALTTPLPLVAAGTTYPVEPGRVGLQLDEGAAVRAALQAGREGPLGPLRSALALLGLESAAREVDVPARVDPALVDVRVEQVRRQVDREPAPGGFVVGEDLTVVARPPQEGRELDVEATTAAVRAALVDGHREALRADVAVQPAPVPEGAARRVAAQARAALAAPVVLAGPGDLRLEVPPEVLAPHLGSAVAGDALALTVDREGLAGALAPLVEPLQQRPRDARVVVPRPSPVLTAQGDASFSARPVAVEVRPAVPGRRVDPAAAAERVAEAVLDGRRGGELPVQVQEPELSTEAAARVDQLIGTFTTSFPCCQNRVQNIQRIAELVDGTVVLPGDVLDLNAESGRRTRARGFLADGAIVDGELVDRVGGGVSQFATTLYNAAWFAGLPIPEHKPHSRYISRYPAGREATLDYASIDLVVRNDTDAPLVLRTATTGTSVTAALYGSVGDRTVRSVTGPRRPREGGGFRVSVSRTVLQGGREVGSSRTSWTYQPPLD